MIAQSPIGSPIGSVIGSPIGSVIGSPLGGGMGPSANFRRMMVFVDGENLVMRYQSMLGKGATPRADVTHVPNVFVWSSDSIWRQQHVVLRVSYYTYAVGSHDRIEEIEREIKALSFDGGNAGGLPNNLYPVVFKKRSQQAKRKGVDISMAVDILNHVHNNNVDTVYLITGDGDFAPLIKEVIRGGKQVHLASLSDGLSPMLMTIVDRYVNLDIKYFEPVRNVAGVWEFYP